MVKTGSSQHGLKRGDSRAILRAESDKSYKVSNRGKLAGGMTLETIRKCLRVFQCRPDRQSRMALSLSYGTFRSTHPRDELCADGKRSTKTQAFSGVSHSHYSLDHQLCVREISGCQDASHMFVLPQTALPLLSRKLYCNKRKVSPRKGKSRKRSWTNSGGQSRT